MDSEGKFWFSVWTVICAASVLATVIICISYSYNNRIEVEAISKASDPQAVACAMLSTTQDTKSERCAVIASQRATK